MKLVPVFHIFSSLFQNLSRFLNILRNHMMAWFQVLETLEVASPQDTQLYKNPPKMFPHGRGSAYENDNLLSATEDEHCVTL